MKLSFKYRDLAWWFWLVIWLAIGAGLAGFPAGYDISAAISAINLVFYGVRDRSLVSFPVQVRGIWLALVLASLWPPLWWMFMPLFLGVGVMVLFDRCGIARMLIQLPWNAGQKLT